MALITCKECGGTVSDTAKSCPHCGYNMKAQPVQDGKNKGANEKTLIVAGLVFVAAFVIIYVIVMASFFKKDRDAYNKGVQDALTVEDGVPLEDAMKDLEESIRDKAK